MATMVLEPEPRKTAGVTARPPVPLSDWQRRRILIEAAASAALGARVRILDIKPLGKSVNRWVKNGRTNIRMPRPATWTRRRAIPVARFAPEAEEDFGA